MESSWLETHWARPLYLAFAFCLALGLLQAAKLYLRRQRLLRDLRDFPMPPVHWFHGHQKVFRDDDFDKIGEIVEKYPRAFPCWVGRFQVFFYIYDPDYAKIFLSRTDPKSQYLHKFLIPSIGKGLINLEGPKWFQHRRLLTPGFHFNILKTYVDIMICSVNIMLDKWEKLCGTQDTSIEVSDHIHLMALDTIMKCAFSQETNCQINSTHDAYVKATFEISRILYYRTYNFLYHHDMIFKLSPLSRRLEKLNQVVHRYTENIIQQRKKSISAEMNQDNIQKRKYQDFLDIVLSAQAKDEEIFSDTDIRSEVNTFMFAGHDTTASSLTWLLYCLAQYPEHQDRCREEIRAILGDGSSINWDQLAEMSYTMMCIKEMLRIISPLPAISRELSQPLTFPDGCSVPAGMTVVLSIWGLHHNPTVWKNPKVFDPLRFSPENSDQRHPHAFLPFSAGPRNCIGQQFAIVELKVAIALILLRFKVSLDRTKPVAFMNRIVLKPKHGLYLHLTKLPEC
ncbi:cytochrome P450 4X1 [Nycticebus coucang]|uniref:cytochrome P450 4X1 n=1 Tax=Nycticebus coucang TaxID=9470 RepID=UPI00234C4E55|nr:cytochrome P450 4X1 [Nycticebus coucang]